MIREYCHKMSMARSDHVTHFYRSILRHTTYDLSILRISLSSRRLLPNSTTTPSVNDFRPNIRPVVLHSHAVICRMVLYDMCAHHVCCRGRIARGYGHISRVHVHQNSFLVQSLHLSDIPRQLSVSQQLLSYSALMYITNMTHVTNDLSPPDLIGADLAAALSNITPVPYRVVQRWTVTVTCYVVL